jgi:hypothetical protein
MPSATHPNPTFEVNVVGVYTFRLTTYDENDTPSMFPAEQQVLVIPPQAIHVELTWSTPSDPDESDEGPEAGSDLDLHFAHPLASEPQAYLDFEGNDLDGDGAQDPWFNQPWDCFWFNHHPDWGSFDPAVHDDPGLDLDDTDGAGPEMLNLNIPENEAYRVGVHYWDAHGFGLSYATVRVFIYGTLVFEAADVDMAEHDMWEVCRIEWPSGNVQPVLGPGGGVKITHDYNSAFFFQP